MYSAAERTEEFEEDRHRKRQLKWLPKGNVLVGGT